jgi:hypothetical protein
MRKPLPTETTAKALREVLNQVRLLIALSEYCIVQTNGPISRGQVPRRRNNVPSHCHSLRYAACDRQTFELICDQIWQNKCKHFGYFRVHLYFQTMRLSMHAMDP